MFDKSVIAALLALALLATDKAEIRRANPAQYSQSSIVLYSPHDESPGNRHRETESAAGRPTGLRRRGHRAHRRLRRSVFRIPDAHRAGVMQGLEQAERGELVSDDDMAALWKQCGL